jgi:anti-sigma factor RsiW
MSECERWTKLTDAAALGEVLNQSETEFVGAHAGTCESCAAEHAVYQSLAGFLGAPEGAAHEKKPFAKGPLVPQIHRGRKAAIAAGLFAVAAAAILFLRGNDGASPRGTKAQARVSRIGGFGGDDPTPRLSLLLNGVNAEIGTVLEGGDVLSTTGHVCLAIEPNVQSCFSAGTVLQVEDLSLSHRRLRLVSGQVFSVLDPQPPGTSFGIITSQGESVAVGTAFQVIIPQGQMHAVTKVLHGIVAVSNRSGQTERVVAHQAYDALSRSFRTMSSEEERAIEVEANEKPIPTEPVGVPSNSNNGEVSLAAIDAARLLNEAQRALAQKDWPGAQRAFTTLESDFSRTDEAQIGRLANADLQMGALKNPSKALALFEAYLAQGGRLNEQALYGKLRALRALKRTPEAQATIDEFRSAFPLSTLLDSP